MNERVAGTIHEQAEALAAFSSFTYEGALHALRAKPEVVEKANRMIAQRGMHELERYLEDMDQLRLSSGRRITRLSTPRHAFVPSPRGAGSLSHTLLRIAGYSAFLACCVFVWLAVISVAAWDIEHGIYEMTMALVLGVVGWACFADWLQS